MEKAHEAGDGKEINSVYKGHSDDGTEYLAKMCFAAHAHAGAQCDATWLSYGAAAFYYFPANSKTSSSSNLLCRWMGFASCRIIIFDLKHISQYYLCQ